MIAPPKPAIVEAARHDLENAVLALRTLIAWIERRQLMPPTPVAKAMLEHAGRALIALEATLRLSERRTKVGQPGTADELAVWTTVVDALERDFCPPGGSYAALSPPLRRVFLAMEKTAWGGLSADYGSWPHERAEMFAASICASYRRALASRPAAEAMLDNDPTTEGQLADDLEKARRDEMHRRGERDDS
jgi:hypothetical protein